MKTFKSFIAIAAIIILAMSFAAAYPSSPQFSAEKFQSVQTSGDIPISAVQFPAEAQKFVNTIFTADHSLAAKNLTTVQTDWSYFGKIFYVKRLDIKLKRPAEDERFARLGFNGFDYSGFARKPV